MRVRLFSILTGDSVMKAIYVLAAAILVTILFAACAAFSEGNPSRGQRIFGACAACHSLQPDQNMTGPSLADLWNRQAGSVASFNRYSPALQSSNIVWNDKTLDEWIKDPQQVVPGNQMTFAGIKDNQQRTDLLAFLKEATRKGSPQTAQQGGMGGTGGMMGGMGGMMGGGRVPNLKHPDPAVGVHTISYCKDTYTITMANGQTRKFGNAISA
jgi:cytochrome c